MIPLLRYPGRARDLPRALATMAICLLVIATSVRAEDVLRDPAVGLPTALDNAPLIATNDPSSPVGDLGETSDTLPTGDPGGDGPSCDLCQQPWSWQWAPANVIYHSYMAGVHEPRMALVPFYDQHSHSYWDATLGGRAPLLRYGDHDPLRPQGYQLDFYGAAIARLDAEHQQDLEACDYVFGFPITYGIGNWQFKTGYTHVSSHLGDERAIREPGELADRINYVRDGVVFGSSYYPISFCRVYCELNYAFHDDGGAKALGTQFGTELAQSQPTGPHGAPFLAINGHLRQEVDWGGDVSLQTGWMRRGDLGQTWRVGLHYFTGKSSQFELFRRYEQQLGMGMWYDF